MVRIRIADACATVQVVNVPAGHDYIRCLYAAMPKGAVIERPLGRTLDPHRVDILHLHEPARLTVPGVRDAEAREAIHLAFVEAVRRSPVRVVWTMHNRLPHGQATRRARRMYRAWAAAADAVIHHSQWGMDLMRRELPYRPDARHVVIPVGHFGRQMPRRKSRRALERELGLRPCAMRFGVLGRPQKDKQVPVILRAFRAAGRADQQLLVTAVNRRARVPGDPRIRLIHYQGRRTRAEIARHVHVCDALVCAHAGPTYLTSAQVADAIGAGIPMLANDWPFFRETMGAAARYYDGTAAGLARLFAAITPADIAEGRRASAALRPRHAWDAIAAATLALFRDLCRPSHRTAWVRVAGGE